MKSIIATILVLGIIVLIHELGHFWAARSIGVSVMEFSIGMGPRLYKRQGKNTVYSVRALPLGGYCLFDSDLSKQDQKGRSASILGRRPLEKIYVSLAGPILNFVLAALILAVLFSGLGVPIGYEAVLGEVQPGSPAAIAGLMPGDRIVAIEDQNVADWQQMTEIMSRQFEQSAPGIDKTLTFQVQRAGEALSFDIKPEYDEQAQRYLIGIIVDANRVITTRYGIAQGIWMGAQRTVSISIMMLDSISQLFTGEASVTENMSGPVGLVQIISETASTGMINTVFLMAFLSINLGILNLLPIPALDGGKIVIYLIEVLRGKPMDQEKEGWINLAGYALLMALFLLLTYKDILKLFQAN